MIQSQNHADYYHVCKWYQAGCFLKRPFKTASHSVSHDSHYNSKPWLSPYSVLKICHALSD